MEDKLRAHMDHLFRDVPPTKKSVELKEEILQNLVDKYHDLISEGKSEEAAYNIAIASIGDISELLESLKESAAPNDAVMNSEYRQWKKRSSILIPAAVMLYICCIIPPIVADEFGWNDALGASLMFLLIGIATAIIIFNNLSKPEITKVDSTIMEEFKEWKTSQEDQKKVRKSITSTMWALILILYFLLSFSTGAWYITWVIFLMGAAANNIIKAIFELKQ